jgi:hypothetical protein
MMSAAADFWAVNKYKQRKSIRLTETRQWTVFESIDFVCRKMFADVDVFISNYTLVDPEVYQLWVDGCSCKYKKIKSPTLIITVFLVFGLVLRFWSLQYFCWYRYNVLLRCMYLSSITACMQSRVSCFIRDCEFVKLLVCLLTHPQYIYYQHPPCVLCCTKRRTNIEDFQNRVLRRRKWQEADGNCIMRSFIITLFTEHRWSTQEGLGGLSMWNMCSRSEICT